MKLKIILLIAFLFTTKLFACLRTTQYKTFPIGIINKHIISVDMLIDRSGYLEEKIKSDFSIPKIMWHIASYISVYDTNGKLIYSKLFEKNEIKQKKYITLLQAMYHSSLKSIRRKYPRLTYFKLEYLSFCDFQKKCEILELKKDTLHNKNFLFYKTKKYSINLNRYKKYEKSMLYTNDLSAYLISSVRKYKAKNIEIIVGHLEYGHEISMGWITNNPNKKPKNETDIVIHPKEKKPTFDFSKLENAVYEEPLLHHAYGFDFLITAQVL